MLWRSGFAFIVACSTLSCASTMKGGETASGGAPGAGGHANGDGGGPSGGGGTTSDGGTPGGGGTSPSGGTASGGQSGSGGSPGDGGTASSGGSLGVALDPPNCPTTTTLPVRLVGRHDGCTAGGVRQAWSGTGFVAQFSGTGLSFEQDGPSVEYTVIVDGSEQPKVVTQAGRNLTVAAAGLSAGEHVVEVYRRGEASFGTTTLFAVQADGGVTSAAPAAQSRLIEVIGDSISCGYGNEGADTSCGFSADTENHYMAYGSILARTFDADVSTVAWSGRGVVSNYNGEAGPTLPDLYERAIPDDDASVWDFAGSAAPNLVIINLSTNDYSTDHDPTDQEFVATYAALLEVLRAHYPKAAILCTVGPMLTGTDLDTARANIAAAVAERVAAGDGNVRAFELTTPNDSPGCDWHPTIATHTAIAAELAPVVTEMLGW